VLSGSGVPTFYLPGVTMPDSSLALRVRTIYDVRQNRTAGREAAAHSRLHHELPREMDSSTESVASRLALEGVVIVASILAAFALDTWWDSMQDRREERETLVALRGEFSAARETIERYRSIQQRILVSLGSVTDSLDLAVERGDNAVSVPDTALAWAYVPPTTSVSLGTLGSLLSSGRLGLLQDRELRSALGSWGHELAELTEEEVDARVLAFGDLDRTLRVRVNTHGLWAMGDSLIWGSLSEEASAGVRTIPVDTELLGVFQLRTDISRHAVDEFPPLLEAVDRIIRLIDQSL